MSECQQKDLERLIYPYQLGLLNDEETRQLEIHLLECDSCFEKFKSFKETARLLSENSAVRQTVTELAAISDNGKTTDITPGARDRKKTNVTRLLLVAAVVAVILILQPWRIDFYVSDKLEASESILTIVPFNCIGAETSPDITCKVLANLLITDLSESHYFQVTSFQQLNDIVDYLGYRDTLMMGSDVSLKIAQQARARWVLTGEISRDNGQIIATSRLVEIPSGKILGTQKAISPEGVFALADSLSHAIKTDLPLPSAATMETARAVSDITTKSPEAFFHYVQGVELHLSFFNLEAAKELKEALNYDSTFAMAHYYMSKVESRAALRSYHLDMALKYSANVSRREKYYIESAHAFFYGNPKKAEEALVKLISEYPNEKVAYFELGLMYYDQLRLTESIDVLMKAIAIDPVYKGAYNQLAYTYSEAGEFPKAIEAIDKYIALVPDEPNPYDSRGEIYLRMGEPEKAALSFRKALQIKPDYQTSRLSLAWIYLQTRDFVRADSFISDLVTIPSMHVSTGRTLQGIVPLYQGQFRQAIEILEKKADEDLKEKLRGGASAKLAYAAQIAFEMRDTTRAFKLMSRDLKEKDFSFRTSAPYKLYLYIMAFTGNQKKMAEFITPSEGETGKNDFFGYLERYSQAMTALAAKDYARAADDLKHVIVNYPRYASYIDFHLVGIANLESGQYDMALKDLQMLDRNLMFSRVTAPIFAIKNKYYLGRAFEALGQRDKARMAYKEFMAFWGDGDFIPPEIEDARARIADLP